MADEFFEANGVKVSKSLFKNDPEAYERLRAKFVSGAEQMGEAWSEKQKEEKQLAASQMSLSEKAKLVEEQKKQTPSIASAVTPAATTTPADEAAIEQEKRITAEQNVMPQFAVQTIPVAPIAQAPMMQATTTQRQETKMGKEQEKAFKAFSTAQQEVAKTATAEAGLELEKQKEIGIATEALVQKNVEDWASVEASRIKREEALKLEVF